MNTYSYVHSFYRGRLVVQKEILKEIIEGNENQKANKAKQPEERQTTEIKYFLKDLNCANCASKIEEKIKGLQQVSDASLDLIGKTLKVKVDKNNLHQIDENVNNIVKFYEPDVETIRIDKDKKAPSSITDNGDKKEIIKLAISAICFLSATIFTMPQYFEYGLLLISYILSGGEVLLKSLKNIKNRSLFDENFLMTIATIGAFAIGEYPEAAAVMLFYSFGEFFQDLSVNRSRKSILALMDLKSDYANLKIGNKIEKVSPDAVVPGDIILIKPGERVPLDGTIIKGQSSVDTSPLTGEPVPRDVRINDQVLGGFINKSGVLMVEVNKAFSESTISKILELVQNASTKKSVTENFITKFAKVYTPIVVVLALILAFGVPIILSEGFDKWIYRALVFLVVSCPCALVLSVPLSFFSGIGTASKKGILIKGTNYLEVLAQTETVVFDKTGTLTKGIFKVHHVSPANNFSKEEILKYAAHGEAYSNHPIATSIVNDYLEYKGIISREIIKDYMEIPGLGVKAEVFGKEIIIGNKKILDKFNITYQPSSESGTTVYVAIDGVYAGYIVISDEIKEDSKAAVMALKAMGIKVVMLTGDVEKTAEETAGNLGIDEYYSQLLPHEKVYEFEKIQENSKYTVFVGDGINDAPVLARADAGIAMGALGSDAAVEAADIVVMMDEPIKVAESIKVAKATKAVVWQNIIFVIGIKVLVLLMGAFGYAAIWQAVFADVGVALIAVLNSLRIFKVAK